MGFGFWGVEPWLSHGVALFSLRYEYNLESTAPILLFGEVLLNKHYFVKNNTSTISNAMIVSINRAAIRTWRFSASHTLQF